MAYLPTARQVSIDLTPDVRPGRQGDVVRSHPRDAEPSRHWPVDAEAPFSPPGAQDWLLILESAAGM